MVTTENKRTVPQYPMIALIAFIVAALIPAFITAGSSFVVGRLTLQGLMFGTAGLFGFSAAAILIIGGPTFALLLSWKRANWLTMLLLGLFDGVIVVLLFVLIGWQVEPWGFLYFGIEGALSALVFWLMWKRGVLGSGRDII